MVTTAAPWTTWISRISLKLASSLPKARPEATMPTKSMVYMSAMTFGRTDSGARSVARARPAVCVVCSPAPTRRNATAEAIWPMITGPWVSPDKTRSANGMMARPPNCTNVPIQM